MSRIVFLTSLVLALLGLAGCEAFGVPATSDPQERLNWANGLVHGAGRPYPADGMIWTAMKKFEERGDEQGLANAYRSYGSFLSSAAVTNVINKKDFRDQRVTRDTRYEFAMEYFDKARESYMRRGRFDGVAYTEEATGWAYQRMGDLAKACEAFARGGAAMIEMQHRDPHFTFIFNDGTLTIEDHIASVRNKANCPG